jgi:D-alanyl-D-alanine carboxypeptidase (penicillin-binding protein 5/6)
MAGNFSSASDLVTLATYLLEHNGYFRYVAQLPSATLVTGNHRRYIVNRNDLVGRYPWINGVKTGHTSGAGYVLVGSGTRHGMTLLSAVLGTSSMASRDSNTLALLDYGFANFRLVTPVQKGAVIARPTVRDRPGMRVPVIASSTFTKVVQDGTRISTRIDVPRQLTGPLKRHAVVGTVVVFAGRRTVARIPLLLARRLAAVSPLTIAARFLTRPFTLLVVLVLLALATSVAFRRRGHPRVIDPST